MLHRSQQPRSQRRSLIEEQLETHILQNIDIASLPASALPILKAPPAYTLLPQANTNDVAELRNHLLASHWVAATASHHSGTAGLSEADLRALNVLLLKDISSASLHSGGWGPRRQAGGYRGGVKSNPLRVFPYPVEISALMRGFFIWHDEMPRERKLHALLRACQSYLYFLFIHPFVDGNGSVGRTLMQDYMLRQGYLPVVMQNLERAEYLKAVSDGQDGKPREFVERVLAMQLDLMMRSTGEISGSRV